VKSDDSCQGNNIEVAAVCTRRTADVASQNRYETVLEEMDKFFLKHLPIK